MGGKHCEHEADLTGSQGPWVVALGLLLTSLWSAGLSGSRSLLCEVRARWSQSQNLSPIA